jgi:hypothetical protein
MERSGTSAEGMTGLPPQPLITARVRSASIPEPERPSRRHLKSNGALRTHAVIVGRP